MVGAPMDICPTLKGMEAVYILIRCNGMDHLILVQALRQGSWHKVPSTAAS